MARRKVSTTVYIEADQEERLKELSKRTRVPVAVYIREAVTLALAKHGIDAALQDFEAWAKNKPPA